MSSLSLLTVRLVSQQERKITESSGKTLKGIQYNRYIDNRPETEYALSDRQIPHWQTILEIAAKLSDETDFGYLGVDIVLERDKRPVLLEINPRPGLSIQIANGEGLIGRLEVIE
ncbi:MAG: ATP-grasp domain-containing protein [Okeania sp. SIO3C4]|nr:ATP-grasp domain-containing protein [Okeania sp. SIO3C4]